MISVVIPVGPSEANKRWLDEALMSLFEQTYRPEQVLIIDDMAGLIKDGYPEKAPWYKWGGWNKRMDIWESPWLLGVAHAFNFGVALARNELVFLLGSDDYLDKDCLEYCMGAWEAHKRKDAYYYVGVRYLDDREDNIQTVPCNAAMVTKGLWRKTGGFATESAVGTPDANFISQLMVHNSDMLIPVANGRPLYNYRVHDETDTSKKLPWQGVIRETRNLLTDNWKEPAWGRTI